MKYIYLTFKIYIILFIIIKLSKQEITRLIDGASYAIIFDASDDNYNVITPRNYYVLNKQNNTQKNTNSDTGINLDSKALLFKDLGNTYNLLFGDVYYTIKLSHNKEIEQTSHWPECFIDFDLFGYFTEKITLNSSLDNMPNELNETIIYDILNNDIIFYYFNESSKKTVEYELKGIDIFNISCRMFEEDKYICSFTTELYLEHVFSPV